MHAMIFTRLTMNWVQVDRLWHKYMANLLCCNMMMLLGIKHYCYICGLPMLDIHSVTVVSTKSQENNLGKINYRYDGNVNVCAETLHVECLEQHLR